tara:strand:+ start:1552 stop:1779 length:228 start_codon:yes stop_codon:yes gene_type:complete
MTVSHVKKASIANKPSGGGSKLQGLPTAVGVPISFVQSHIGTKAGGDRRNMFFSVNQLAGGIARKGRVNMADGLK